MADSSSSPVTLYIYDLSAGMAKQLSMPLTGKQIDGIWHTSIVAHGVEVFYGHGISIVKPGTSHHGQPLRKLEMGETYLDKETFLEYVEALRDVYTAEKYHLLDFNCNTFTADVCTFLNGSTIPSEISNLPKDFLSTPFGQALRPQIDSMFRRMEEGQVAGAPGHSAMAPNAPTHTAPAPAPSLDQTAAAEMMRRMVAHAFAPGGPANSTASTGGHSVGTSNANGAIAHSAGVAEHITTAGTFSAAIANSKGLFAMFTDEVGCPPCRMIRPYIDQMAAEHGEKVKFVIVDIRQAMGLAREYGIRATPTFKVWIGGKERSELEVKGGNRVGIKSAIDMIIWECFPPHKHNKLSLPMLIKLSNNLRPITYLTKPQFSAASTKLNEFLLDAYSKCSEASDKSTNIEHARRTFKESLVPFFSSLDGKSIVSPDIKKKALAAIEIVMESLDLTKWFPVIDLTRYAVGLNSSFREWFISTSLLLRLLKAVHNASQTSTVPNAVLLTTFRLLSNCLSAQSLRLSNAYRTPICQLILYSLQESKEKNIRVCASGLVWSFVGRLKERGEEEGLLEDWEMELLWSVVEGLEREVASEHGEGDVVQRLLASLGLLVFQSPHADTLEDLIRSLELEEKVLKKLAGRKGEEWTDARALAKEVARLIDAST
ncbi:DUF862-domain-containing protein [Atractiella rhizophila]|nr:DUF862-domain-containing protein [Atractiella rhizophila]